MTNEEYIKSMDTKQLSEYIYSVYLAGVIQGRKENNKYINNNVFVNYEDWLKNDFIDKLN